MSTVRTKACDNTLCSFRSHRRHACMLATTVDMQCHRCAFAVVTRIAALAAICLLVRAVTLRARTGGKLKSITTNTQHSFLTSSLAQLRYTTINILNRHCNDHRYITATSRYSPWCHIHRGLSKAFATVSDNSLLLFSLSPFFALTHLERSHFQRVHTGHAGSISQ